MKSRQLTKKHNVIMYEPSLQLWALHQQQTIVHLGRHFQNQTTPSPTAYN